VRRRAARAPAPPRLRRQAPPARPPFRSEDRLRSINHALLHSPPNLDPAPLAQIPPGAADCAKAVAQSGYHRRRERTEAEGGAFVAAVLALPAGDVDRAVVRLRALAAPVSAWGCISDHVAARLNRFIPDFVTCAVAIFLQRQSAIALAAPAGLAVRRHPVRFPPQPAVLARRAGEAPRAAFGDQRRGHLRRKLFFVNAVPNAQLQEDA
jgi:hypothetical protein